METPGADVAHKSDQTGPPGWHRRPAFWLVIVLLGLTGAAVTFYNWRTIARFCQTPSECLKIVEFGIDAKQCVYYEPDDARIRTFLIPPRTKQILNDVYVNRKIINIPTLALSQLGPSLDVLFYLQKSEGIAIKSVYLQDLFRNHNVVALLELLVPAGGETASDPRRKLQRIEFFETARRLLVASSIAKNDKLKIILPDKPLLTGGLEPIFTVILTNADHRPVFVEEIAAVVDRVVQRAAHMPQEPVPLPEVLDIRLRANAGIYRHRLSVPLEIAAKSEATVTIRLIREEEIEHRYEMKFALSGAGFEIFTASFNLRM